MKNPENDLNRRFGSNLVDDLSWGTHLCQFYESKQDLIDILVPYFAEGLRSNEFCMWVTSQPLEVDEAKEALRREVPDLEERLRVRQIEIVPYSKWYLLNGKFDSNRVLQAWVQKENEAVKRGFEGLRLTGNTLWVERDLWKSFVDYEEAINSVIGKHRMIAVCTYSLPNCTGTDVLDVIRNHVGTLVKQGEKWYLVEDAARRKAANRELQVSDQRYSSLFENMQDGFSFHKVSFDEGGKPIDYVFLEINHAFEQLTGLRREKVIGRKVTEVLPGIEKDPADWLAVYGRVASTGKPTRFESFSESLNKWFSVSAYSPEKNYFAVTFEDITERKKAEEENKTQRVLLERIMESIPVGVSLVSGKDLRYILVNSGYAAIAPGKEMLGKPLSEVWPEVPGLEEICKNVLSTGEPYHSVDERFEIRRSPHGDLETTYFSWSLFRVRLPGESGWGILNTAWETTKRKNSEDALRQLNERFEMAQHAAGAGVWDWDIKTGHIDWTAEMFKLFGLDPQKDKASLESWRGAIHPDDREKAGSKIDEALKTHSYLNNEYRIIRPDGRIVWINALGQGEYDDKDQPFRMTGICIDITERKKAEEMLSEQSLAIASAPDAVFSTDESFTIKSWNRAAERIFGWKAEEAIGKVGLSVLHPVYPSLNGDTRKHAIELLHSEGSWRGEIIYHKKDGSPIPVSVSSSLVKDKNGKAIGTVIVAHDITARKKREEVLKEAQRDLNRAQAVAKTGSWRLDTLRNILEWSDENYRIFGVPKEKPMTYEKFLEIVHPCDRDYVDLKWKAALKGDPYDIEHRIIVGEKVRWVREKAELEFEGNGKLLGGFGTTQDITDLVEMREKLEFYNRNLEGLVEEKTRALKDAERMATIGQTAGMVGHDIRNPLQAIIGDLYLAKAELKSLPNSEEKSSMQQSMDEIGKNTEYIGKIISDLQDFAKPLNPYVEETNLKSVIDEVLRNSVLPDDVQSEVYVEDRASIVKADVAYLKRIVGNLVTNAIQAMPKGGKLRLNAYRDGQDAVIVVEDTGVGIPETAKSKLFAPLFTTKSRGQGFGLAVVKRLTEALKGNVSFESEMGKGTRFTVRLPQYDKR